MDPSRDEVPNALERCAAPSGPRPAAETREPRVTFTSACDLEERAAENLDVVVPSLSRSSRGRLFDSIDDAIERALEGRGAPPPGLGAGRDYDASLSDKLYRARQVGVTSLRLAVPSLLPLALDDGALGPEDSSALTFWARATSDRPVRLRVHSVNERLSLHVVTTPLREALAPSPRPHVVAPRVEPAAPRTTTAPEASVLPLETWRSATLALTAARGPQPLATLERLFATSYLPLDVALSQGRATDPRAVHARDEFRATFRKVYTEAFQTFAVTGKRPRMVLDAPDVAVRVARQHSARTTQLLLVDGLRFDVGGLVRDELTRLLAGKAALTDELLLWSALPTHTDKQLATLARGVSELEVVAEGGAEEPTFRGRTAQTIRRVRVGSRDLYRLDLCASLVHASGPRVLAELPEIARAVAASIARHAASLAPRTLLLIFGDHGFTVGREGEATSGGASPEEVLVPAFAFLTGETH